MSAPVNQSLYGGSFEDYQKRSAEAVKQGCEFLKVSREKGTDLREIFTGLLDLLAKHRKETALIHRTENAHYFGRQRLHTSDNLNYTCLAEKDGLGTHYKPYNDKILAFIHNAIKGSIPLKGSPKQKKIMINDQFEGRNCSFAIELLTSDDLSERELDKPVHSQAKNLIPQIKSNPEFQRIDDVNFPKSKVDFDLLDELHSKEQSIKKNFPEFYNHAKLSYILKRLIVTFPSPQKIFNQDGTFSHIVGDSAYLKSIYVLAKLRVEMDGKMYALSEYLTWTYQDFTNDPVDRLKRSAVIVIHQDRYLIEPTLNEISQIFKQALQWNKSHKIEELKTKVALIRYLFAHAMPYSRGSAAIAEYLEEVIYQDREVNFRRVPGKSGDLEAFVSPLWSTYRPKYDATIELS